MNYNDASLVITPNGTKASKLYAIKPTSGAGDLSVVRATSATRVNANGIIETVASNVPRIDYSGGGCPSILVEPQRTNLQTYSEDFTNLVWAANLNASASANLSISPDGTMSADKIIENTSNSTHYIGQTQSGLSGVAYTISVFAKASERNFLFLFEDSAGGRNAYFDLTNGVVGNVGGSATAKIENFGNGWYKCSVTYVSSGLLIRYRIGTALSNGVNSYLGNGTSGLFIWGAQIEAGSYATSYIPTTSAAVTRNADVIPKTGISSLIGQTEGTMFLDAYYPQSTGNYDTLLVLTPSAGVGAGYVVIDRYPDNKIVCEYNSGGSQAKIISSSTYVSQRYKIAFAYKQNDFVVYINGVQIGTDTSGLVNLTLSDLVIPYTPNSSTGKINTATLFKNRLTNAELAELTTL
jgi:hypothetical protein